MYNCNADAAATSLGSEMLVVLAAVWQRGKLGLAAWDGATEELRVSQAEEGEDYGLLDLGALLGYVRDRSCSSGPGAEFEFEGGLDPSRPLRVSLLRDLAPPRLLRVDVRTMTALSIFARRGAPSLHGVLGRTKTPAGRRLLRTWLLRPACDAAAIGERLDAVQALIEPAAQELVEGLRRALAGVRDLDRLLARAGGGGGPAAGALRLHGRHPRYLLAVAREHGPALRLADFELAFATGDFSYFKGPRCRELDAKLGDVHGLLVDVEARVVREVEERVLEMAPLLRSASAALAALDWEVRLPEAGARARPAPRPVAGMLREATRRSLLLLDEFGKGTAFADGLAILAATVRPTPSR
eukprot:tig00000157_g9656.t1